MKFSIHVPNATLFLLSLVYAIGDGVMAQPSTMRFPYQPEPITLTREDLVQPRNPETVVAVTRNGELTIRDIQEWTRVNPIPWLRGIGPDQVPAVPRLTLEKMAGYVAVLKAAAREADALENWSEQDGFGRYYTTRTNPLLMKEFVHQQVSSRVTMPKEDQIRSYYEDNKIQFKQKFGFRMRHLILSTYEPYVVGESDPLPGGEGGDQGPGEPLIRGLKAIAGRINGDPGCWAGIRVDIPGQPARFHETPEKNQPLEPGEKLLVPMNEERAMEVRRRLVSIMKKHTAGVPFEELIDKYSDTEEVVRGRVSPMLPPEKGKVLDQLIEMGRKTSAGGVSPVFRTKHGWQVIEVVEKREEGTQPLQAVYDDIFRLLLEEQQKQLVAEAVDMLFSDKDLRINYDVLLSGDELAPDTLVATLGDREIPFEVIQPRWIRAPQQPGSPEEAMVILRHARPLVQIMVNEWISPRIEDTSTTLSQILHLVRVELGGSSYIQHLAQEQTLEHLTPGSLKAHYEENREALFKMTEQVRFESVERRLSPYQQKTLKNEERAARLDELKASIRKDLAGVRSAEGFKATASRVNASLANVSLGVARSLHYRNINLVDKTIREQIARLEPGQFSEPFVLDDFRVLSVLLTARLPGRIFSFEEARSSVEQSLGIELAGQFTRAIEENFKKQAGVRFVLNDSK